MSGYNIEVGRYFYDDKPMIGQIVDINVWDQILTDEQIEKITNCTEISSARGNLVNEDFDWELTGKLVTSIDIPKQNLSCKKTSFLLHIPVRQGFLSHASDLCNKISADSIGPIVNTLEDYSEFYKSIHSYPAYRERCFHGSRMLHWFPYLKPPNKEH